MGENLRPPSVDSGAWLHSRLVPEEWLSCVKQQRSERFLEQPPRLPGTDVESFENDRRDRHASEDAEVQVPGVHRPDKKPSLHRSRSINPRTFKRSPNDDQNLDLQVMMHEQIWPLAVAWTHSMANRPPAGIDGRLLAKYEMPKMAFRATKRTNIDSVVTHGLFPGGLSTDGSPVRPFVMLSTEPIWLRLDNERASAKCRHQNGFGQGLRVMITGSGCLQTPDWISDRRITYIYKRRSNEPVWRNRAYGFYRQRLDALVKAPD